MLRACIVSLLSGVSLMANPTIGYVPYGWQHKEENVFIPVQKGKRLNCFGLLARDMRFHYALTNENINATFVLNYLDSFSHNLAKLTVIVMDNASVHQAKMIQDRLPIWQERGLMEGG